MYDAAIGLRLALGSSQPLKMLPASLVGESIAHSSQGVTNGDPFRAADDANVLHRQDGEEQVLVGAIVPVLAIHIE